MPNSDGQGGETEPHTGGTIPDKDILPARIINVMAITITFVWAASFLADIIFKDSYDPSPYVHFIMMALVGSAFGRNLLRKGVGE